MISLRSVFHDTESIEILIQKGYIYEPYANVYKDIKPFCSMNTFLRIGSDDWYSDLDSLESCCFQYGVDRNDFYPLGVVIHREKATHVIRYIAEHSYDKKSFCRGLAIPKFEELFAKEFGELYQLACSYPFLDNLLTLKIWLRTREEPLQTVSLETMYDYYYANISITAKFNLILKSNNAGKIQEFIDKNKRINSRDINTEYISTPEVLTIVTKKFGYYLDKQRLAISVLKQTNIPLLTRLLEIYPNIFDYKYLPIYKERKEEINLGTIVVNVNDSYLHAAIGTNNPRIVTTVLEKINRENQELAPNLLAQKTYRLMVESAKMDKVTNLMIKDNDPNLLEYALEGGNEQLYRKVNVDKVTTNMVNLAIEGGNYNIIQDMLLGDVKVNPMHVLQKCLTKSPDVTKLVILWLKSKYDVSVDQIFEIKTYCVKGSPYTTVDLEKINIILDNTTNNGNTKDMTDLMSLLAKNRDNSKDILEFMVTRFPEVIVDWSIVNKAAESVLNYRVGWYINGKL